MQIIMIGQWTVTASIQFHHAVNINIIENILILFVPII